MPESEVELFPQVSAGDIARAAEFGPAGTEEQHGKTQAEGGKPVLTNIPQMLLLSDTTGRHSNLAGRQ